jgi:hypothetical protein
MNQAHAVPPLDRLVPHKQPQNVSLLAMSRAPREKGIEGQQTTLKEISSASWATNEYMHIARVGIWIEWRRVVLRSQPRMHAFTYIESSVSDTVDARGGRIGLFDK